MKFAAPVGLVPAAGFARRLGGLPCSKEILPVGWESGRPVTGMERLLHGMGRAGVREAIVVIREGKWDIPAYLGTGAAGVQVAYRVVPPTRSVPETLAAAGPWIAGRRVALGFPDILITPDDALGRLAAHQAETGADVALALFPTDRADKSDMAETGPDGRLVRLWIKAGRSDLATSWGLAVWGPRFTELLLAKAQDAGPTGAELWVGDLFNRAVDEGLQVTTLALPGASFLDVGTPDALAGLSRRP